MYTILIEVTALKSIMCIFKVFSVDSSPGAYNTLIKITDNVKLSLRYHRFIVTPKQPITNISQ